MAIKKNYTEEFLLEFKKVEQLLQKIYGSGKTFRDVEQALLLEGDAGTSGKMQVCRNIRNYAVHNPDIDDFMPIPEEACRYMRRLYIMFESKMFKVKDAMSKIKALSLKDEMVYAAGRLSKAGMMPVVDDQGMLAGIFNDEVLRKCVVDKVTSKTKLGSDKIKLAAVAKDMCISQQDDMENIDKMPEKAFIVTDTGKPKGKYVGMVIK